MHNIFLISLYTAFELIYCENEKSIFENPTQTFNTGIKTLWVQNFGMIPYNRITYIDKRHIGIGISNFGNQLYRENEFIISYGIIHSRVKFGTSTKAMMLFIKEKRNQFTIGTDIGASFQITNFIVGEISIHNINLPKIGKEEIPKRILNELKINFNKNFLSNIQIYKEGNHPLEVRMTNDIKITEIFSIITGIRNYPSSFTLGILLNKEKLHIAYLIRTHTNLGLTHIIGINFLLTKTKNN